MSTVPHRIDVHHHILPLEYVTALSGVGVTNVGRVSFPQWSVETMLATMDRQGIATAITSFSAPGVYFGDRTFAKDLARRCNELSARLVSEIRAAWARLPWFHCLMLTPRCAKWIRPRYFEI